MGNIFRVSQKALENLRDLCEVAIASHGSVDRPLLQQVYTRVPIDVMSKLGTRFGGS